MTDTTDDDAKRVAEIAARAEKAGKGPWRVGGQSDFVAGKFIERKIGTEIWHEDDGEPAPVFQASDWFNDDDPQFIAHARTDVPYLCALATRQAEEIARLRKALEFYGDPRTYLGIGFMADPPCGDFGDDVDDAGEEFGMRPGKRARAALPPTGGSK